MIDGVVKKNDGDGLKRPSPCKLELGINVARVYKLLESGTKCPNIASQIISYLVAQNSSSRLDISNF